MSRFPGQLETERLILRPPVRTDGRELLDAIEPSYAELHEWMEWARKPLEADDVAAFLVEAERKAADESEYTVLLTLKPAGRIVGVSSLIAPNWDVPKFEIGYWLHTDLVGHGYVSESTRALTTFAFENLGAQRVQITMDDRNQRSWSVAERLGFEWEATLKAHARNNAGKLRNTRVYAMLDLARLR